MDSRANKLVAIADFPVEEAVVLANMSVELEALADNCAPAANAVAWRFAKELFEPGAPGLIANTMPLPQ